MKKIRKAFLLRGTVLGLCIVLLLACSGQNGRDVSGSSSVSDSSQDASNQADISFDTLSHDFGTILEGEMVVCYFEYENSGTDDLLVSSVKAGCGCTTPNWDKEPLKPGEKSSLEVMFDARGRSGSQLKSVTVLSSSLTPSVSLTIKANVINNK